MPDHVHGILTIHRAGNKENPVENAPLGTIIGSFKAAVTRAARIEHAQITTIWQRGYHDRIIRTERELQAVHRYILANPARWLAREGRTTGP